eukprot:CCRYP_013500-RA/>CCRYP_013500-RA protein AED:0.00 eAED:0.00 QI:83/-1/1/1/-1/1/1/376/710
MKSSFPSVRRRTPRTLRRRDGLIAHAANVTSQNGEDGIIARIFDLLPHEDRRVCVDVGAWDGRHLSNTYALLVGNSTGGDEKTAKWSGVLIEADRQRFQELKALHEQLANVCICANVSCQPDSPMSLTAILNRDAPHLPENFDFLSIDVDGIDYWLLYDILGSHSDNDVENADSVHENREKSQRCYRPKVICIEFNPTMPMDLIYIQPRNDLIRHGSSLSAIVELANSSGYVLVETTTFNAFFVERIIYEKFLKQHVPDTTIEALHEITMGTSLYQLYDGTIKLWGCKRMLWHRLPMDEEKMQVLPMQDRQFPFAPSLDGSNHVLSAYQNDQTIRQRAVDMSPYCKRPTEGGDTSVLLESKRECFLKLNNTLRTDGFAFVRGTGISSKLCNDALKAAKSFLHNADESVRRSCLTKDRARRGYSPMCTENFASLIGQHGPNDLVKKFRVGPEKVRGKENQTKSLSSLHQQNSWPKEDVWREAPHFRSVIEEYYDNLRCAADSILAAICDGIIANNAELQKSMRVISEAQHDQQNTENHTSILTLLGYQPGSRHKKGSKGYLNPLVAAHTDVGMITVLLFDNGKCASLQRRKTDEATGSIEMSNDHDWMDVDLPFTNFLRDDDDPVFVVNVGDCLSELTGGYLRSTLHRVIPRTCETSKDDKDLVRTSLALFVGLEESAQLVLPSGDTLTYEEWRRQHIARALDVVKNTNDE